MQESGENYDIEENNIDFEQSDIDRQTFEYDSAHSIINFANFESESNNLEHRLVFFEKKSTDIVQNVTNFNNSVTKIKNSKNFKKMFNNNVVRIYEIFETEN